MPSASRTATAGQGSPDTSAAVAGLIQFLETGSARTGSLRPMFSDLSLPQWRIQSATAEEILAIRPEPPLAGAGAGGARRADRPRVHDEERWDDRGQRWYCREMIRADVVGDSIAELSIFCTSAGPGPATRA